MQSSRRGGFRQLVRFAPTLLILFALAERCGAQAPPDERRQPPELPLVRHTAQVPAEERTVTVRVPVIESPAAPNNTSIPAPTTRSAETQATDNGREATFQYVLPETPPPAYSVAELRHTKLSGDEIMLSAGVLIFGLILMLSVMVISVKTERRWGNGSQRLIILILIITGSMYLLTAGYSNEQMTPVIGLLGTIVGYLLGAKTEPPAPRPAKAEEPET